MSAPHSHHALVAFWFLQFSEHLNAPTGFFVLAAAPRASRVHGRFGLATYSEHDATSLAKGMLTLAKLKRNRGSKITTGFLTKVTGFMPA